MRWLFCVLARLTLAASCTNSAAVLDAQVDRSKSLIMRGQLVGTSDVEFI
jgi:hypothetical protein